MLISEWMILILAFCLGAIFGSFITALVYRTRHNRSINERHSVCPHCQHPLGLIDLFPILSYLWLRGRCRHCNQPISRQYVITELSTALLFTASAWMLWQRAWDHLLFNAGNMGVAWVVFSGIVTASALILLIALFIYDLRWGILPNQWNYVGSIIMLIATIAAIALQQPLLWQPLNPAGTIEVLYSTLLSGILAGGFFLAIVFSSEVILRKPGMGMGDVKLAVFLGLMLGFPGIVVSLYLAFVFGAVLSLLLIAGKRKKIGNSVPFGPFMVGGALLAMWLTPTILDWYNHLWF